MDYNKLKLGECSWRTSGSDRRYRKKYNKYHLYNMRGKMVVSVSWLEISEDSSG